MGETGGCAPEPLVGGMRDATFPPGLGKAHVTSQSKREGRKVLVAIVASLLLHVLVALSVAAFNRAPATLPTDEDQPVQLTMVDLPAASAPTRPANPAYLETDPARETAEQPQDKTFESNANSIAASKLPAAGDAPLPSQEGREQPFVDLQTQEAAIPTEGSQARPEPTATPEPQPTLAPTPVPTPSPRASEPPKPTPTAEPLATPEPDKLAMLTSTPPPAMRETEEPTPTPLPDLPPTPPPAAERPQPQQPSSGYQPQKTETRIAGRITNRGPSAADAVATPLGKYRKAVHDAIGARWYYYVKANGYMANIGTARVDAEVAPNGKITNLRVVSNSSNETFANICLQSFQEAQIPPIPPDLVPTLPGGRLPLEISFTFFAN
jgi:outer membrane biosynthesis protein TonB